MSDAAETSTSAKPFMALGLAVAGVCVAAWAYFSGSLENTATHQNVLHIQTSAEHDVRAQVIFPGRAGQQPLAHYTEHLAWMNAVGGQRAADRHSNAWTNSFSIGYWLSDAPEALPDLLDQLRGVFDPIDLPETFALEEKDIVLREYDLRVRDNPAAAVQLDMDAFLYAGNPYADSVLGTPEEIRGFTYEAAKSFHAETHRPETAVLLVTGGVSARDLRRALKSANWPELPAVATVLEPVPFTLPEAAEKRFRFEEAGLSNRLIWRRVVALPEPVQFDLLEAQTALLRKVLDTNLPGGLAGPLRFDAQITRSFGLSVWPLDERHIEMSFSATTDAGVTRAEVEDAFEALLAEIAADGLPKSTFDRVLKRFEGYWPDWSDEEETSAWMASYVEARIAVQRLPLSPDDIRPLENKLSLDAINALLRAIATGQGRTAIAYTGPENF